MAMSTGVVTRPIASPKAIHARWTRCSLPGINNPASTNAAAKTCAVIVSHATWRHTPTRATNVNPTPRVNAKVRPLRVTSLPGLNPDP